VKFGSFGGTKEKFLSLGRVIVLSGREVTGRKSIRIRI
jgi:hypothetical protein